MGVLTPLMVEARDAPIPVGSYLNGVFPEGIPGAAGEWLTIPTFPNLTFTDPMWVTPWPGSDHMLMVERVGKLKRFPNRQDAQMDEVETLLDWTSVTQTSYDEQGFYSAVFHPKFADTTDPKRFVYICYTHQLVEGVDTSGEFADSYWRLTRIEFNADGEFIPGSETILISLYDPQQWHNGGAMFFGEDGLLYVSNGDGGDQDGSYGTSQQIDRSLFACIIRIDVDQQGGDVSHPIRRQPQEIAGLPAGVESSYTQHYYIPSDNPWVAEPLEGESIAPFMEELYAIGLRSPHSMQYDHQSKQVWIGDVGQLSREELNMFVLDPEKPRSSEEALNFGWNIKEGFLGPDLPEEAPGKEILPIHDYGRSIGICIIGGFIYRGSRFEEQLGGKTLFGDNRVAKLWSLEYKGEQPPIVNELTRLSDGGILIGGDVLGLTNLCQDKDGEIILLYSAGAQSPKGRLYTLEYIGTTEDPPPLLSQTGAFTNTENLTPSPALLPYAVNSPLWSDNAAKRRWIVLPNDGVHDTSAERIGFHESANWTFPAGTVLVKHFELPTDLRDSKQTTRLETRFIVCLPYDRKYGVTYRWNEAQTDAILLEEGETGTYSITQNDGTDEPQIWQFPSRSDCITCHNSASGQALGVRTHQLNGDMFYGETNTTKNQLKIWDALGMFDSHLDSTFIQNALRSASLEDETYPLEHRVRSYLDANCAHCHQPGGNGPGFDARLTIPLNSQNLINTPLRPDLEGRFDLIPDSDEDAQVVPGQTALSAIHYRLTKSQPDSAAMPPLAKMLVDQDAVTAVAQWIESLSQSEFQYPASSPLARYVRIRGLSELEDRDSLSVSEISILDGSGDKIPFNQLSIYSVSSEETDDQYAPASFAIDGNANTFWVTEWGLDKENYPHWVVIDLGIKTEVSGFTVTPRNNPPTAIIKDWEMEISEDANFWRQVGTGSFRYPDGIAEQAFTAVQPIRPVLARIGGSDSTQLDGNGEITVTITLNHKVASLPEVPLEIVDGDLVSLSGKGYFYTATIRPRIADLEVRIPADTISSFGATNVASSPLSIQVDGKILNELQRWIQDNRIDPKQVDLKSDDDYDSLKLLLEYAFNLDPLRPEIMTYNSDMPVPSNGPTGLPTYRYTELPDGTSALTVEFFRRTGYSNNPPLNYTVSFSSDLDAWESIPQDHPNVETQELRIGWERVIVRDIRSSQSGTPRFGKLDVSVADEN